MTDEQLIAAHTVYLRGGLTMSAVSALIWRRYGYANQEAARCALKHGWRALGLSTRRRCAGITADGARCQKAPLNKRDHCAKHDQSVTRGWEPPRELLDHARELHETGTSLRQIGVLLIDDVQWKHPTYVAKRLARVAAAEGWHQRLTGGRPKAVA
jgi:hypothetical protein